MSIVNVDSNAKILKFYLSIFRIISQCILWLLFCIRLRWRIISLMVQCPSTSQLMLILINARNLQRITKHVNIIEVSPHSFSGFILSLEFSTLSSIRIFERWSWLSNTCYPGWSCSLLYYNFYHPVHKIIDYFYQIHKGWLTLHIN